MSATLTTVLRRTAAALALTAGLAVSGTAQATEPAAYTARAVHVMPDGTKTAGTVVKSGSDLRMEYTEQGRKIVQILRRAEGVMYLLDPTTQTYFEMRGEPVPDPTGAGYLPPCQENDPAMSCTLTGTEVSSGIEAELWELRVPGQPGLTTILWDGARHRALRQTFPDGTVMKMAFKEMTGVSGRDVEHWAITYETPGQTPQAGAWYYDPKLRVEIREELPTGEIRSLEDIKVGNVDPANFAVPAGWTRQELPQGAAPGPASGN